VPEARAHGADAVLVMLSVLDDGAAAEVIAEARRFGMDALVEAHDEAEVRRAVALGARLIGINNRDLKTLKVDLAVTERLAHLIPSDWVVVAESGIAGRADVERLARHVDAFLVGSSLMRAPDPADAARALVHGRVKVCGLTDPRNAELAAASGAAFLGLIMVPGTPRAVTLAEAERIAAAVPGASLVGVFRDAALDTVAKAAHALDLHAVQLHGREGAAYLAALRAALPEGTEIWAAAAVGTDVAAERVGADRTLFDTALAGQSGGTGLTFDWSRLAGRPDLANGLLAGGLTPLNAHAASRVGAYALDVSSGIEAAPGRKDPVKLAAFLAALRPATRVNTDAVRPKPVEGLPSFSAASEESVGLRQAQPERFR
jgi:indole-3-glycerol phosphate synthase/phosphoribosylanthranilate isomerase